jgi:hypothetical protein
VTKSAKSSTRRATKPTAKKGRATSGRGKPKSSRKTRS